MKFLRWELRHCADPTDRRAYKGGGGGNQNSPNTTNSNEDNRMALQDAVAIGEGGFGEFVTTNTDARTWVDASTDNRVTYAADAEVLRTMAAEMPDAVKFMAAAGTDVINSVGGSVVDLNRDSINANRQSFDAVLDFGARTVDALIDASVKTTQAGTALAETAVQSFQPAENKQADSMKWGLVGLGLVAAVMMGKAK